MVSRGREGQTGRDTGHDHEQPLDREQVKNSFNGETIDIITIDKGVSF